MFQNDASCNFTIVQFNSVSENIKADYSVYFQSALHGRELTDVKHLVSKALKGMAAVPVLWVELHL